MPQLHLLKAFPDELAEQGTGAARKAAITCIGAQSLLSGIKSMMSFPGVDRQRIHAGRRHRNMGQSTRWKIWKEGCGNNSEYTWRVPWTEERKFSLWDTKMEHDWSD